jgi:DNA-binding protein HU-beta
MRGQDFFFFFDTSFRTRGLTQVCGDACPARAEAEKVSPYLLRCRRREAMRTACAIGFGLAFLLAGFAAGAEQNKAKAKPTPSVAGSSSVAATCGGGRLGALDANKDGKIARAEFKGPAKLFAWIDADHNGFITRPEATRSYLAIIGGLSLAEKAHAFRAMDANKDGKISAAEYKGPKARFAMVDANKDGMITGAEARRAYQSYVRGALIAGALKKMDTNKDGMISATEYKGPKAGFARLDVNKDKQIGPREVGLVFRMAMHRPQAATARTAAAIKPKAVKPASAVKAPAAKVTKPASAVKTPAAKVTKPASAVKAPTAKVTRRAAARPVAWIQRLRRIDTNKDGTITKAEYIKACQARWAMLDRDKNGSITKADVAKIMTALRAKKAQTVAAVALKKAAAPKAKAATVKMTAATKATCAKKTAAVKATAVKKPVAPKPAAVKTIAATKATCAKKTTAAKTTSVKKPVAPKPAAVKTTAVKKPVAPKPAAVKTTAATKATCAKKTAAAKTTAVKKAAAPKLASVKKPATPAVARPAQAPPVPVRLFVGLDANKDGKLLKGELMKGIATWFDRIDSDHNNAVTRAEVQAMLAKLHK